MARENYEQKKRQKDLAKRKKQEEKRMRKTGKNEPQPGQDPETAPVEDPTQVQ